MSGIILIKLSARNQKRHLLKTIWQGSHSSVQRVQEAQLTSLLPTTSTKLMNVTFKLWIWKNKKPDNLVYALLHRIKASWDGWATGHVTLDRIQCLFSVCVKSHRMPAQSNSYATAFRHFKFNVLHQAKCQFTHVIKHPAMQAEGHVTFAEAPHKQNPPYYMLDWWCWHLGYIMV